MSKEMVQRLIMFFVGLLAGSLLFFVRTPVAPREVKVVQVIEKEVKVEVIKEVVKWKVRDQVRDKVTVVTKPGGETVRIVEKVVTKDGEVVKANEQVQQSLSEKQKTSTVTTTGYIWQFNLLTSLPLRKIEATAARNILGPFSLVGGVQVDTLSPLSLPTFLIGIGVSL